MPRVDAGPIDAAGRDSGGGGGGTLRVDPDNAAVTVSGGVAQELDYHAYLRRADGSEEDVTGEATFLLSSSVVGSFAGAHFTSATDRGGTVRVIAMARGATGNTPLTVRLEAIVVVPGTPDDAPSSFGGTEDASRAPTFVYPSDGILVPPNLNELEFHFMPAGSTIFELSFLGSAIDLRIYFTCETVGAGCAYTPDETLWRTLADGERGGAPVPYRLRAVATSGGPVGVSAMQTLQFAEQDIMGGLYYWNAGAGSVLRYDFGLRGSSAEQYLDRARAGAMTCVGCHVLSRNGSRIAVGLDIPSPSVFKVYDVGTRTQLFSQGSLFGGGGANFFSFNPDATQMLASNGANIEWRDATTGAALGGGPIASQGAMPDWAPDGSRMVYARPMTPVPCFGGFCGAPGVGSASLETMTFDGAAWADGPQLVPFDGQNNYYPAISPNGEWVMFNRSPSNHDSYNSPDAQVWVVSAAGGAPPVRMARGSIGETDSWPKWDPSIYTNGGRPLMWIAFASSRPYGLRITAPPCTSSAMCGDGSSTAPTCVGEPGSMHCTTRSQIWMTAFDPELAARGEDPSWPAFRVPFQEIASGNHIAQWVTRVDRQPCTADTMCLGGEFCSAGFCVPNLI